MSWGHYQPHRPPIGRPVGNIIKCCCQFCNIFYVQIAPRWTWCSRVSLFQTRTAATWARRLQRRAPRRPAGHNIAERKVGQQSAKQQGPQQIIFPHCPYSSNLTSPERLGFRGLIILNSEHSSILNHLHSGLIARLCFQTSYFLTEVKPFVVFWMNLHLDSWMSQILCQQFDSRDISQQSWLVRLCNVKSLSWWVRWICQWLIYLSNYKLQFTHRTPT